MTIRVELQEQVYQENLDALLRGSISDVLGEFKGVPVGTFTNIEGPVTQFTVFETPFRVTTTNVGQIHTIRVTLISDFSGNVLAIRNRVIEKQVVPVNDVFVVNMPLLKGTNQIEVFTDNDATFTAVTSSHVGTFLTGYAREIFSSTQNPLNEQERALFSDFSSRMTEILIRFQDLYADPKSLRTMINRFVTRAYMTKSGATEGVRDFTSALLGTTPVFIPTKTEERSFEPDVIPLYRRQLEFAGFEAHSWIPNYEIVHWLAFIKLVNNARKFYKIQEIGESEVLILAQGIPEIHRFDFDDPAATSYSEFNVSNFRIVVEITDKLNIRFCAAGYPFDLFVTPENPLGQKRLFFDSDVLFDSGELLDAPAIDPGDDGWVGFGLSGRFEHFILNSDPFFLALDSLFITPAPGSGLEDCVTDGFLTQQVATFSGFTEAVCECSVESSIEDPQENVSIDEFLVDTTLLDFSTFSEFSPEGFATLIDSNDTIALGGTSSVQLKKVSTKFGNFAQVNWVGGPLDFTNIGADTAYLTIFAGEDVIEPTVEGVPSHPGTVQSITTTFEDSSGNSASYTYQKEELVEGVNVLPLFLDFPEALSGTVDFSDITRIEFRADADFTSEWEDLYFGRIHVLANQAFFRPARAKIELEDINNISGQSLYGSELNFTDHQGALTTFTGDETYNNLDENAYIPLLYKIQLTAGVGSEGFDRNETAINLREELGRQLPWITKASVINNVPGEIYLDVFSQQFSATGSRNTLAFVNPQQPDLIDVTSFAGGVSGTVNRLDGSTVAIAQRFTVDGDEILRFAELFLYRVGDIPGKINVSIRKDLLGAPGVLVDTSSKLANLLTSSVPDYDIFRFDDIDLSAPLLGAGDYWLVLSGDPTYFSGADSENHIVWAKQSGGGAGPSATTDGTFGPTGFWDIETGIHQYFKVIGKD